MLMAEESAAAPKDIKDFVAGFITKNGGPVWVSTVIIAIIIFGIWIHHEKEDLVDRINGQGKEVSKDIGDVKADLSKDRVANRASFDQVRHALEVLASKSASKDLVNQMLSEKINLRINPLEQRLNGLQNTVERQASVVRIYNPNQILAIVRSEVGFAEANNKVVPEPRLADLRNAVLAVPQDTPGYWATAQTVVNYTSHVLIVNGHLQDPAQIARPCLGVTTQGGMISRNNRFENQVIPNCIVDLDTQAFIRVVFRNCLIRSRGGTFRLENVAFVNCRFVLELPEQPNKPNELHLLETLLSAQNLNDVKTGHG